MSCVLCAGKNTRLTEKTTSNSRLTLWREEIVENWEYKGFRYEWWDEFDDGNMKRWHDCVSPEGERLPINWSPYRHGSQEEFEAWVEANALNK